MKRPRNIRSLERRIAATIPAVLLFAAFPASPVHAANDIFLNKVGYYREQIVALDPAFIKANETRIRTLFSQLDLARPGLAGCAALYAKNDLKGASEALLDYYAQEKKNLPVDPLDHHAWTPTLERAKNALDGIFTEQNLIAAQKRRPDGNLDWADTGPNGDKEWAWFLNRQLFLRDLAEAYLTTGDAAYEKAISTYLSDWVVSNPYPNRLNFTAQWRPLEAARRITDAWAVIFYDPDIRLTPEARLLLLCSLHDHADDLANHGSFWGGNHLLTEQSALALIATAWPEFKDAKAWLDRAEEVTRREIEAQTYPDGAYKELTNLYQHVVTDSLERTLAVLRAADRHDAFLDARAEKMWDYSAEVMRPNGDGPLNSASDVTYNRTYVEEAAATYSRADWTYIASSGEKGAMPNLPPSRFFPYAGHAVMRSGWTKDSQWAFYDIGPHGTAHQHNDRLHFDISIGKDDILTDCGRYTYQPGEWRDYFSGPRAHNLILIDGKGPLPSALSVNSPMPATAIIKDGYDYFAASNDYAPDPASGRCGARHTRGIFYKRGRYWLVIDNVILFGPSTVETLWHFHPSVEVRMLPDGEISATGTSSKLRIREVYGPSETWNFVRGAENPIQGWYSREYNSRRPATTGTATVLLSRPETTVWLLSPEGTQAPSITVKRHGRRLTIHAVSGDSIDILDIDPANDTAPVIRENESTSSPESRLHQ
jgi:hypothetical protein